MTRSYGVQRFFYFNKCIALSLSRVSSATMLITCQPMIEKNLMFDYLHCIDFTGFEAKCVKVTKPIQCNE